MSHLSKRAEELLTEILEHRDEKGNCDTNYWKNRFEDLSVTDDALLRSLFKELRENEMISTAWADNHPYILLLLAKGLSYFEDIDAPERDNVGNYTNNFYGSVNGVQIQQGTNDSKQEQTVSQSVNTARIKDLIQAIRKYDSILREEYGAEGADKIRKATNELETAANDQNDTGKIKGILEYIRDLSVNAGGGLVATGVIQLISAIMR